MASSNNIRKYDKISDEVRKLIVDGYFKQFKKCGHLSEVYNVKLSTIKSIVSRHKKYGNVERPKGHRPKTLNEEQIKQLEKWQDEDCQRTLDDLMNLLEEYGIRVCKTTIFNYMKKLAYSVKRISRVPIRRNTPDTIEKRWEYANQFMVMENHREKIFFVDETGISLHIRSNYGQGKKGQRANITVRAIKGKNYSEGAAMNINSLFFWQIMDQAYNTIDFTDYLRQFIEHLARENIANAHIVMDDVRFYHAEAAKEMIESSNHTLTFLPAYSPFLNPIENLFNQLKFYVKRMRPTNEDEVFNALELADQSITFQDCLNYYNNMKKYITKCLQKEIIEN